MLRGSYRDEVRHLVKELPREEIISKLKERYYVSSDIMDIYISEAIYRGIISDREDLEVKYPINIQSEKKEEYDKLLGKADFEKSIYKYSLIGLGGIILSLIVYVYLVIIPLIFFLLIAICYSHFDYKLSSFIKTASWILLAIVVIGFQLWFCILLYPSY